MKRRKYPKVGRVESIKLTLSSPQFKHVANFEFAKLGRFEMELLSTSPNLAVAWQMEQ